MFFFKNYLKPSLFILALLLGLFQRTLVAQMVIISPEVQSCAGGHFSGNNVEMSWTVGEVMTDTESNYAYFLTQGFHQSDDIFLNVIGHRQQQIVITPNNDGLNDYFLLEDIMNYQDNEIVIINRWGSPVYSSKPYNNDWYGTNEAGAPLPEATYYYMVKLDIGQNEILYGSITIKR